MIMVKQFRLWNVDYGLWNMDFGFWNVDCGLWNDVFLHGLCGVHVFWIEYDFLQESNLLCCRTF